MRNTVLLGLLMCAGAVASAAAACVVNPEHPYEAERPELGACRKCSADGSTCVECWGLFSLSAKGGCVECTGSRCIRCDPERPGFCLECGDWWGEAEKGFYALENGTCAECPADNCQKCRNVDGTCIGCSTGMGAVDGVCSPCNDEEGCMFCNNDLAVCTECYSGWRLDNDTATCKRCPANCEQCSSSTSTCTKCESGYAVDPQTKLCVKCMEGCLDCNTPDTCVNCDTGYTNMTDGTCAKCTDTRCTTCTPGNPTNCEICAWTKPGWVGGPDESGKCVPCLNNPRCSACQTSYKVCDWCDDGYFNDAQLALCTPCKDRWPHCVSCGLDATQSTPGIPACFGCEQGWAQDPSSPYARCIPASEVPPSPGPEASPDPSMPTMPSPPPRQLAPPAPGGTNGPGWGAGGTPGGYSYRRRALVDVRGLQPGGPPRQGQEKEARRRGPSALFP